MKHRAARLAAAFVAVNLPFWLLGEWYFIDRPRLNLDLLLPLLLAASHPFLAGLSLLVLWTLDLVFSESLTYHFLSPLDFLQAGRQLGDLQWQAYASAGVLSFAVMFATSAWLALRLTPKGRTPWMATCALAVVILSLDVGNGSSRLWQRPVRFIKTNISGSPTASMTLRLVEAERAAPLRHLPTLASATSLSRLALRLEGPDARKGSALLVLVESWGLHHDPRIEAWLHDQLVIRDPTLPTTIDTFQVAFSGPTTAAELRELCSLQGSYSHLDAALGSDCLPAHLARSGWRTIGLHGFLPWMFDRKTWWPRTGLQQVRFAPDLLLQDDRVCGSAFPGVCDEALVADGFKMAQAPGTFVYLLTLNSHLPLAPEAIPPSLLDICEAVRTGDGVCQLTATIGRALRAVREGIAHSQVSLTVVVVGDHAPPFARLVDRQQYSVDRVPAVLLSSGPTR